MAEYSSPHSEFTERLPVITEEGAVESGFKSGLSARDTAKKILYPEDFGRGYIPRNWEELPLGSYARFDGTSLNGGREIYKDQVILPKSEIIEKVAELDANQGQIYHQMRASDKSWIMDQAQTPYCWMYGVTLGARLKMWFDGSGFHLLSACGAASLIMNYKAQGGWGDLACDGTTYSESPGGWPLESTWPNGNSIDPKYDTPQARKEIKEFNQFRWWECRPQDELAIATMLVNRIPVPAGFNFWGHLVCLVGVFIERDRFGWILANSWSTLWGDQGYGRIEPGRKTAAEGIVGIFSVMPTIAA